MPHPPAPLIRLPSLPAARSVLIACGLLLWGINLLYGRPLFIDEANVARNLYDRGFGELFLPLAYEQYAPPLYLVLAKALGEILGYGELPLRLPAFLGGLVGVYGLVRAGEHLRLGYWGLLPLALLFVNPVVLRYVTEVKPYGLDLGVAAGLIALHLRTRAVRLRSWTVVGVLSPWLSLPSVFVLAAIGLDGLRKRRRWLWPIGAWLLSFGLLYGLVLRASVGSSYLNAYHAAYFLPWPSSWAALARVGDLGQGILRASVGYTAIGLLWGGALLVIGAWQLRGEHRWLLLPLLLVVAASALRQYSLLDRLLLFVLPTLWLILAVAARQIFEWVPRAGKIGFAGICLIVLGGTNIYLSYFRPVRFGDGRRLTERLAAAPVTYVHPEAYPVVDYYLRIHPRPVRPEGSMTVGLPLGVTPADYQVLFDVTTEGRIANTARRTAEEAAARGCKVKRGKLFRAEALRIRCPARNSGR